MLARQLLAWTAAQVEGPYPGCFAIVMATGIISNTLFIEGPRLLSDAFLLANFVAYPLLAVLTGVRAARFTHAFWSDLSSRALVFSFFTIVAASSVFGERAISARRQLNSVVFVVVRSRRMDSAHLSELLGNDI
jgi:hypothetical protein